MLCGCGTPFMSPKYAICPDIRFAREAQIVPSIRWAIYCRSNRSKSVHCLAVGLFRVSQRGKTLLLGADVATPGVGENDYAGHGRQ